MEDQTDFKTKRFHMPSKFYVKRNFKTRLTNSVEGILRIQMVRLRERVENGQNFIGYECSRERKMAIFNFS